MLTGSGLTLPSYYPHRWETINSYESKGTGQDLPPISSGGYAAGKGFGHWHDTYGRKVDIASATGVSQLCR